MISVAAVYDRRMHSNKISIVTVAGASELDRLKRSSLKTHQR
jgi:hypothetical protein